jgi:enoyl-CoA hydratase/carnithine racemase
MCNVAMEGADRMQRSFDEYSRAYSHVAMERTDGILRIRLHSEDGPLVWGALPHEELGYAFTEAGADRQNRVVVLSGTGENWCTRLDDSWVGPMNAEKWDKVHSNGRRLLESMLAIEVPVVAVVNGPAKVHAEIALLADIVVASDDAYFEDAPHFRYGTVPADGVHAIWPLLLGPNRGRYFLLMGERISAQEALRLGLVGEVLPKGEAMDRGVAIAYELARQNDVVLRLTRAALTQQLRRMLVESVHHGLALEGLGAHATWPQS